MHAIYWASVFIHIVAATTWIGGILFLVLVAVPWMRTGDRALAVRFLRETGRRFRRVAWWCFGIVLITGTFNLWVRGVRWADFGSPEWRTSAFGTAVLAKLAIFALVLVLSVTHDFLVGPRATVAIEQAPEALRTRRLRSLASKMGRVSLVLGLVLVGLGVTIVRGWP